MDSTLTQPQPKQVAPPPPPPPPPPTAAPAEEVPQDWADRVRYYADKVDDGADYAESILNTLPFIGGPIKSVLQLVVNVVHLVRMVVDKVDELEDKINPPAPPTPPAK